MTYEPHNYRILYFSSQFPNSSNLTMGVFSLQRVLALRRTGCRVVVVSPYDITSWITNPSQTLSHIKRHRQQPFNNTLHRIPAYYPKWICPPKPIIGWYSSFFMFLQVQDIVKKLVREYRPDVILSSWLPDGVAASIIGNNLNIPVLAIADGTDVNLWPQKYRNWNYGRDILNEKTAFIIFVSEALRAVGNSRGLYGRKNIVLHNAVDINLFTPKINDQKNGLFTVLGVGRLIPTKGFHILIEAFAEVYQSLNTQARLIIVGDGPQREVLLRHVERLGIGTSVELTGSIEQEKLAKYYRDADVFCLPSFSEGFPCVVVEAMACGKPVVASRVGGIPELVDGQSGILVDPGDVRSLRDALLQAKNRIWDGEITRRKIVDNFGWDSWTDIMIKLMEEVTH